MQRVFDLEGFLVPGRRLRVLMFFGPLARREVLDDAQAWSGPLSWLDGEYVSTLQRNPWRCSARSVTCCCPTHVILPSTSVLDFPNGDPWKVPGVEDCCNLLRRNPHSLAFEAHKPPVNNAQDELSDEAKRQKRKKRIRKMRPHRHLDAMKSTVRKTKERNLRKRMQGEVRMEETERKERKQERKVTTQESCKKKITTFAIAQMLVTCGATTKT